MYSFDTDNVSIKISVVDPKLNRYINDRSFRVKEQKKLVMEYYIQR